VIDAALAFDALTEGLATIELRRTIPHGGEETRWQTHSTAGSLRRRRLNGNVLPAGACTYGSRPFL